MDRNRNNVVLSRRVLLEEGRKNERAEILEKLSKGMRLKGTVSSIVDFGAFVDLGGIDGLIHISELSWSHVNHPSEVVKVGEEVEIIGLTEERKKTVITGLEMFRKVLDFAEAGDNVGALLRGIQRTEIERGQVLAKPGTIHPHTKFRGQVYVLTKDEGGRHTPFFNNYRPQFYFRTTDVTGVINLPEGTEMCMPGDNVEMDVELITPIAIEEGLRFAIREGGRTVGSGVVIKINE